MRCALTLLMLLPLRLMSQALTAELLSVLSVPLNETSGLIVVDDAIWTILDSGNPSAVYQVDPSDGNVLRTVQLVGAPNTDFEEITADADWVYVGDFGNNAGSRANLRIYRFPRAVLTDPGATETEVDTIRFVFPDQVDFTPAYDANNFDCEAFIAVDDSLFLFSKRWLDNHTRLYALPAVPGDHVAEPRGLFACEGRITAASWDGVDRLVLLGYEQNPGMPFTVLFSNVIGHDFFGAPAIRRTVNLNNRQTEGIAWRTPDEWIITNEQSFLYSPALWSLAFGQTVLSLGPRQSTVRLAPQPADLTIRVEGISDPAIIRIHDAEGRAVKQSLMPAGGSLDVSGLAPGLYAAEVTTNGNIYRLPLFVAR